jgi:Putative Flp pilus-assembly TadE/G-like
MRDEQGSVAVIVALGLTVLLGVAALAVDLGLTWAVRAEAQTAADAAALAGAARLPGDPAAALAAAAAALADDLPGGSLPAGLGWAANGDEGDGEVRCWRPPDPTPPPGTPCVAGATAIQVVTPPVREPYAFAGVFGRAATDVRATARAAVLSAGELLPWGLLAGDPVPPGGLACLAAVPAATRAGPCQGAASLQALDSPRSPCQRGGPAYVDNLEAGIDHPLAAEGALVEDACDPAGTPTVMTAARGGPSATGAGLLGVPDGRLRDRPALGGVVLGAGWDGDFLDPAEAGAGGLPVAPGYTGGGFFAPGHDFASYQACLTSPAAPGCAAIFAPRLVASARFGYLPLLEPLGGVGGWPGPGGRLRVVGFQAAFIGMPLTAAGQPTVGQGAVAAVTVHLLPAALLPDDLVGPGAGGVAFTGGPRTVRLTG